jgi:hypothetical protein
VLTNVPKTSAPTKTSTSASALLRKTSTSAERAAKQPEQDDDSAPKKRKASHPASRSRANKQKINDEEDWEEFQDENNDREVVEVLLPVQDRHEGSSRTSQRSTERTSAPFTIRRAPCQRCKEMTLTCAEVVGASDESCEACKKIGAKCVPGACIRILYLSTYIIDQLLPCADKGKSKPKPRPKARAISKKSNREEAATTAEKELHPVVVTRSSSPSSQSALTTTTTTTVNAASPTAKEPTASSSRTNNEAAARAAAAALARASVLGQRDIATGDGASEKVSSEVPVASTSKSTDKSPSTAKQAPTRKPRASASSRRGRVAESLARAGTSSSVQPAMASQDLHVPSLAPVADQPSTTSAPPALDLTSSALDTNLRLRKLLVPRGDVRRVIKKLEDLLPYSTGELHDLLAEATMHLQAQVLDARRG